MTLNTKKKMIKERFTITIRVVSKNIVISKANGFTLIELLITLSILTIIGAIAIPNLSSHMKNWEAIKARYTIANSFNIARSESLINRQNIIMCPTNSDYRCDKNATKNLLIFSDSDGNNQYDAAINKIISVLPLDLDYGKIFLRVSAGRNHIKFFGNTGTPRGHIGHIKYCPDNGEAHNMFKISINHQGIYRYKAHKYEDSKCP